MGLWVVGWICLYYLRGSEGNQNNTILMSLLSGGHDLTAALVLRPHKQTAQCSIIGLLRSQLVWGSSTSDSSAGLLSSQLVLSKGL